MNEKDIDKMVKDAMSPEQLAKDSEENQVTAIIIEAMMPFMMEITGRIRKKQSQKASFKRQL